MIDVLLGYRQWAFVILDELSRFENDTQKADYLSLQLLRAGESGKKNKGEKNG